MRTPGKSLVKSRLDLGDRGDVKLKITLGKNLKGGRARVSGVVSFSRFGWTRSIIPKSSLRGELLGKLDSE